MREGFSPVFLKGGFRVHSEREGGGRGVSGRVRERDVVVFTDLLCDAG